MLDPGSWDQIGNKTSEGEELLKRSNHVLGYNARASDQQADQNRQPFQFLHLLCLDLSPILLMHAEY